MKNYPFFHDATANTFNNARMLRKKMTMAENLLWKILRKKQLDGLRFRRQHPVGNFILDFYCHDIRLALEVDGFIHTIPDQKNYDLGREKEILAMGIKILRITNEEIFKDINKVREKIMRAAGLNSRPETI